MLRIPSIFTNEGIRTSTHRQRDGSPKIECSLNLYLRTDRRQLIIPPLTVNNLAYSQSHVYLGFREDYPEL